MQLFHRIKKRLQPHIIPLVVLCLITMAVYAPSLGHEFLTNWDDNDYITANSAIKGFTLAHVVTVFSSFYGGNYAPLQIISYMFDYEIWGMRAMGFIFTNILIHLLNGLIYYRLLVLLAFSRLAAFVAAFIFLLHPVQVESVAWLSQRKNVLAMFFFLMAFTSYVRYMGLLSDERAVRRRAYSLSLITFAGALLAKSVAVILPLALLLYDACYLTDAKIRKRLLNKIPFALLAISVVIVTLLSQQSDINSDFSGGRIPYHGGSPYYTFLTMLTVMVQYFRLLLMPNNLSAGYYTVIKQSVDLEVIVSGTFVIMLICVGILLFKKRRILFFWYTLFFLCLLPVSQIIPLVTLINDRYLYFPMLGAAALAGLGMERIFYALQAKVNISPEGRHLQLVGIIMLSLMILPYLSLQRSKVWQNAVTLWNDTVSKVPIVDTWFAQANAYHGRNDLINAKRLYLNLLSNEPTHRETLYNLAMIYMDQNNFLAARPLLQTLTTVHPTYALGFQGLGDNYYITGDVTLAEINYRKALNIKPNLPKSLLYLGNILLSRRELKEADFYLTKALSLIPRNSSVLYSMACLRSLEGNLTDSLQYLDSALRFGYRNKKSLFSNSELNNIRSMPEFTTLISKYSAIDEAGNTITASRNIIYKKP